MQKLIAIVPLLLLAVAGWVESGKAQDPLHLPTYRPGSTGPVALIGGIQSVDDRPSIAQRQKAAEPVRQLPARGAMSSSQQLAASMRPLAADDRNQSSEIPQLQLPLERTVPLVQIQRETDLAAPQRRPEEVQDRHGPDRPAVNRRTDDRPVDPPPRIAQPRDATPPPPSAGPRGPMFRREGLPPVNPDVPGRPDERRQIEQRIEIRTIDEDGNRRSHNMPGANGLSSMDELLNSDVVKQILNLTKDNLELHAKMEIAEVRWEAERKIMKMETEHQLQEARRAVENAERMLAEARREQEAVANVERDAARRQEESQHRLSEAENRIREMAAQNEARERELHEHAELNRQLSRENAELKEKLEMVDVGLKRKLEAAAKANAEMEHRLRAFDARYQELEEELANARKKQAADDKKRASEKRSRDKESAEKDSD
ncbi:MAG: hypothetical protein KDB22_26900 [Planctomycetales bacterium]|nr:hypothetical protein [Planctomycetales bacterium]